MKHKNPVGWLRRSSPTILICISAIGLIGTAVLAAKAAPKAKQLLEEAEEEKGEELTKVEVLKTAGPVYIPAVATGALTLVCMFGANSLSQKTQASIASAYALLDNSYKRYRGKIKELFGEEADEQVRNEIAVEEARETMLFAPTLLTNTTLDFGVDDEVERTFYEPYTNKKFISTIERVLQAEYTLNRNFVLGGTVTVNDFLDYLGLTPIDGGDAVGWSFEEGLSWIDFNHSLLTADDGFEFCVIDFVFDPMPLAEYDLD